MQFLGEETPYWIKLRNDLKKAGPSAERFFKETVKLSAKVAFYEQRIKEMVMLMEHK